MDRMASGLVDEVAVNDLSGRLGGASFWGIGADFFAPFESLDVTVEGRRGGIVGATGFVECIES